MGFDTARGDVVTVQDLAFDDNRPQPPATSPNRSLRAAEDSPNLVKYAALLMGLLVVVAFGLRPAIRHARHGAGNTEHREERAPGAACGFGAAQAQAPLSPPEPAEIDPERLRSQEIFEQVTTHLKREPTQSSRLLQSWIHSD